MKRFIAIALAIFAGTPGHAQQPTGALWCYQYVLATWTPRDQLAAVLKGIENDRSASNAGALDSVAQFLLDHLDDEQLSKDDAKAVLSFVARTRSGRFNLVMGKVRSSARPKVLTDMARDYVLENKKTTADQYVPGTIDFAALRAGYVPAAIAIRPTEERARKLGSLKKFSSFEDLFALMGPPQHVEARYYRFSETIQFSRLVLYYRGAGRVTFGLDDTGGWLSQATVVDPLAFELLMPYRARAAELGLPDDRAIRIAQLLSGSSTAVRIAIEDSYQLAQVPIEFLDTAAEILAQNWQSPKDEFAEDLYAWMIRVLRTKGGTRYGPLLAQIADETPSRRIRKWAKLTVKNVEGIPRTSYVIGSVVLAEQARKFPSPYPDVTYTNGRL